MKLVIKTLLIIFLITNVNNVKGQNSKQVENKLEPIKQAVIVGKPEKRFLTIKQSYFEGKNKEQLLQQINKEQLEEVKKYSDPKLYPPCVKQALQYAMPADPTYDALKKTYDLCTIYKIAKIGKIGDMSDAGEISLLMIPASENSKIGEECYIIKDIYFFIPSNAVLLDWD
jgi:hypothetical protein